MAKLSLVDFRRDPATHIVSLGGHCATTFNLRRFFGFKSAFPFDWWITPRQGLLGVLERPDPALIYDPDQLELAPDATTVRHRSLGVLLHHEFPRYGTWPNDRMRADFLDFLPRPRQRTTYLIEKFLDLNQPDNRVLFVRENILDDGDDMSALVEQRLARLFDRAEWTLAALPGVRGKAAGWQGDPSAWDAALATLDVRADPSQAVAADDNPDPTDESIGGEAQRIMSERREPVFIGFS